MTAVPSTVRVIDGTAPSADARREPLALADTAHSGADAFATDATAGGDAPASGDPTIPPRVGRFLVIRTLGAGGMGVVAEAYDPELDRRIALKLLKSDHARRDSQTRLLREAQAMARLSHPNVVQVYDVGLVRDQVFIAMELVRGQTLGEWLAAGRRDWRDVVRVFVDAGKGLAAAHAAGLVHRDFKPDNVLIAADGRVRVADFGLAREDQHDATETNPGERKLLADTLTATGAIMGTPIYMSPEQHRGAPAGPASDIFSFSVALFEALHGARPFAGETMTELARNVQSGTVAAAPARGVPAWLDAAVRRGLAPRPEDRYPDFPALLHALARDPASTRRRWLGGAVLGLGAAALGFALQGNLAAEVCTGGPARIAEVYDDTAATRLRERLAALPPGEREATEQRVVGGLSAYASAWSAMHRDACLAHRRGEHTDALFDARTRCLEERRAALGEAVGLIVAGDALREASTIVARLPSLAPCADAASLTAELPLPAERTAATLVDEQRRELARARVLATGGRAREAIDRAVAVRQAAERVDYQPLIAEARLVEGRVAMEAMLWPEAADALAQAHVAATAARHDVVAAEAKARALWLDGAVFGRLDAALAERPLAEAWVARLGRRRDLQALLAGNIGVLLQYHGDQAGARERFAAALRYAADDPARDPVDHARGTLTNAARATVDPGERDRLFEEADALLVRHLGPAHPTTLTQRMTRADYTDDPAAAVSHLAATCPAILARRAESYDLCVECYVRLGHAADELARPDEAAQAFQSVGTCLDAPVLEVDRAPMAAQRALADGYAALLRGDPSAALARLAEAEATYAPMADNWWIAPILADVELATARALVATGRGVEAAPRLERAIAALTRAAGRDQRSFPRFALARARATLAEIVWPTERPRALQLFADADAFYRAAGPGYAARLAELAAWRSARASD